MKKQITFTLFFMMLFFFQIDAQVFVKSDATGANDGSSWENAFTDLEIAIASTSINDQIWVAAGTYKAGGTTPNVDTFFTFPHDLELYGGFAGTETMISERDLTANETILSGDHNGDDIDDNFDDNKTDNSYHIMWLTDTITSATIIDGLTFKYGNTQPSTGSGNNRRGGGILSYGSPTVINCLFTQNYGYFGGGIYPRGSGAVDFSLENCVFMNNRGQNGACMYNNSGGGEVTNCTFDNNESASRGGAVYNGNSSANYTNCTFSNNTSASTSGGLYCNGPDDGSVTVNITNCTFTNNTGGFAGSLATYDSTLTVNVMDCTFDGNTANSSGGAISLAFQATLNINNSTLSNNSAPTGTGGAIYVQTPNSTLNIDNSDIFLNGAERGGAISNSGTVDPLSSSPLIHLNFTNTFFRFNSAIEQGGAINASSSELNMTNCVIESNLVINTDGIGGGISLNTSDSITANYSLLNCTVANNNAFLGAGISHWLEDGIDGVSTLTLQNTIFNNPDGNDYEIEANAPTVVSNGGNLIADATGFDILTGPNDLNGEDPLFVSISDSDFHLLEGSPCIDAGIDTGAPLQDIEGNDRVDGIDMGAFENQKLVGIYNPIEKFGELNIFPNPVDQDLNFSFSDTWTGEIQVQIVDMQGKVLSTQLIEKQSDLLNRVFNVKNLAKGIYSLHISNGSQINSQPFMKK